jgi:hypothetical protein
MKSTTKRALSHHELSSFSSNITVNVDTSFYVSATFYVAW